ncbi:ABC-2 type transport system permease protein [Agreia bicolorata]|uniref:ABC-2 type transport system permease protein n=1 Tax=Agreia bicolorata TaxID=110935 RepID=A0A1T4XK98_9MICO|nr:ABC transporter permease subunit [Agreia bicolorata]SKA89906.1 ABC-2 type transport system permease protein [Agreia bicolorata]
MSTLAQPALARSSHIDASSRGLSTTGILRSEWIKLRSLRSTWWSFGIIVAIQIGMAVLFSLTATDRFGEISGAQATDAAVSVTSVGLIFGQLVIAVLGVLVISGEYATGQIRSSFMAVPSRLPVLAAKAIVFSIATFVVTLVSIVVAYFVTMPILAGAGVQANPFDGTLWLHFIGAAGFLVMIGLVSLGIGATLRSTPGGIAASLGLLLVAPTILVVIPAAWANTLAGWTPSSAGQGLYYWGGTFEPWQALLVMLGWVAVFITTAAVLMKRRDA